MADPQDLSGQIEAYSKLFQTLDEPLRSKCRVEYLKEKITLADPVTDSLRESFDSARESLRKQGIDPDEVTKP